MKQITTSTQVPKDRQYVIVEFGDLYIPSAEPRMAGFMQPACSYFLFDTETEWREETLRRSKQPFGYKNFVAMICVPAKIKTEVVVEAPSY